MWLMEPPAHGLMNLTPDERMVKAIDAGVDQIGGETIPERLVALVKAGKISEQRINSSTQRILLDKFRLGLFDNPFVDVQKAVETVGKKEFRDKGEEAQRKSLVLLKNANIKNKPALPLNAQKKYTCRDLIKKLLLNMQPWLTVRPMPISPSYDSERPLFRGRGLSKALCTMVIWILKNLKSPRYFPC
jgi:beta-glucosidase-like glycosyl hydrolase